jgi:DNA invertase Pin-like site-specific DNA recombinase
MEPEVKTVGKARKYPSTVAVYPDLPSLVPVGEYVRLSIRKRDAAVNALALDRQAMRPSVEDAGAYVSRTYTDPDHSASKRDVVRPGFDAMMDDLLTGVIKGIAVYDIDRLTRLFLPLEVLCDFYEAHPKTLWFCEDDEVDLRTEKGRMRARERVRAAREESLAMARRQAKRHRQLRGEGIAHTLGFGWTKDGRLDPRESALLKAAARCAMDGGSLGDLMKRWHEDGVRTRRGGSWNRRTIQDKLLCPAIVGYRVDKRTVKVDGKLKLVTPDMIARDDNKEPIMGTHEALLTIAEWRKVRTRIEEAAKLGNGAPQRAGRKCEWSGYLVCGRCGCPLSGSFPTRSRTVGYYGCTFSPGKGCGKVRINMAETDKLLRAYLRDLVSAPRALVAAPEPWPLSSQLTAVEARLTALQEDGGELDEVDRLDQLGDTRAAVRRLKRARAQWERDHPVASSAPAQVWPADWEGRELVWRRSFIGAAIERVTVAPAPGNGWDPDRLTVTPR